MAKSIHQQPNHVKSVMNSFVIAVACYVKPLHKLAVDTANGIGKVAVDIGRGVQDSVRDSDQENSKHAAQSAEEQGVRRSVDRTIEARGGGFTMTAHEVSAWGRAIGRRGGVARKAKTLTRHTVAFKAEPGAEANGGAVCDQRSGRP